MSWETRNGIRYYYTAKKVNGRVTKAYFGRGPLAELAAGLDAEARRRRIAEAEALRAERMSLEPIDRLTDELDRACARLLEATLLAAGYWRPNYGWRRRRTHSTTSPV